MFTKRKLAKLMENKNDNKQEINYKVLDKAKEETGWNDACEVKVIDNRKQKLIITAAISCMVILIALGIFFGIALSNKPNPLDPLIYYSYNEDNIYKYESVEKYNKDKNRNILYFDNYQNINEVVKVYTDKRQDVLLRQEILLMDTYEHIELIVELQNNYVFDFLTDYDKLKNKTKINGVQISYTTTFSEEIYLYKTLAKFSYKGNVYRAYFEMEGEKDWQEELSELLA